MSDLLQQAIIDATALKEAAIKNAENLLVEKYSEEFKQTVEKLLEQEAAPIAAPAPVPDPAVAAAPNAESPDSITEPALDPTATATGTGPADTNKRDAFANVKTAFLDGDENDLITINFDQIKSTLNQMMGNNEELNESYDQSIRNEDVTLDNSSAGHASAALEEEMEEELELDEEWDELEEETLELDEDHMEEVNSGPEALENLEELELELDETSGMAAGALAAAPVNPAVAAADKKLMDADAVLARDTAKYNTSKISALADKSKALKNPSMEEELELTEDELAELEEAFRVDINVKGMGRGQMGTTESELKLQRNAELADAQDEDAVKEREEEKEKMSNLVKENEQLKTLNNKMLEMLETLKEQVEKMNVSNAKLLYTNKALANISLNERQKNQIVESISKADSVLAAKTIYETVQNAVENAQMKKEAPQALSEALNRSATPFVVKKSVNNSVSDIMSERLKALAGIKPNK